MKNEAHVEEYYNYSEAMADIEAGEAMNKAESDYYENSEWAQQQQEIDAIGYASFN
jgi:hypothetical protein